MLKHNAFARPLLLAAIPMTMLLAPLPSLADAEASQDIDPDSGMIIADGWEIVKANCTACHSAKLVTQNHGSRNHWKSLIR
ncbi:MAG TPA: hypothetical protein VK991_05100, partial [Halomonas sp.]|nr:hypothetical protein [Halomonas sp.]